MTTKTRVFDVAEMLDRPEVVQAFLNEAVRSQDPDFIAASLETVSRARELSHRPPYAVSLDARANKKPG